MGARPPSLHARIVGGHVLGGLLTALVIVVVPEHWGGTGLPLIAGAICVAAVALARWQAARRHDSSPAGGEAARD